MRSLSPLLGHTRRNSQRNPGIRNRLKVNNLIEDIKLYQKIWLDDLEGMDRSRFSINPGDDGMLKHPRK
jgi:hypothetical protein